MIKIFKLLTAILIIAESLNAQQISVPRIDLMPDLPQPYIMRNWKEVAQGYDSLVFNKDLSGQYLPLVFFRETNVNYPEHQSFGLHTAVGTVNPAAGESINLIPAVVGASLVGIDKSAQFGQNWALMCEEYFNKRPEENIYLNHPVTSSGNDWWYETMPNIFFLQLNYLYPHTGDFDYQVETLADQWLTATTFMGGSATPWNIPEMNYRAWAMDGMKALETGVKEPEAAGAIAWILFNAWNITGNTDYRVGAEWCLEYLDLYPGNPSYELQLPYGVYTAARLNAEMSTDYDIEKMLNWCFNRGELRGWGCIVGRWGDYDCSGLIGEANDEGNDYAFIMNGFEHAGALVPMVRYDDRFATAIAKWVLNLANASRLFYSKYLPGDMQDNEAWSSAYDPNSFIAYESMKEVKNQKSPYATGDAIDGGWAETNLILYGSSHVGILGGIVDTTNIEAILCLDLLKTDYYRQDAFPSFLYYNPWAVTKSVSRMLPAGTYDLYDAISNTIILTGASGECFFDVPAKGSVMTVIIPSGSLLVNEGKKTMVNNTVVDYNNGAVIGNYPPRIKALVAENQEMETNSLTRVYCTALDPEQETLTYEWTSGGTVVSGTSVFEFTAPPETGTYTIKCRVSDPGGRSDSLSTSIEVLDKVMYPPVISSIRVSRRKIRPSENISIYCQAYDENNDALGYEWITDSGQITSYQDSAVYTAPASVGNYYILCRVSDTDGLMAVDSIGIMVRDLSVTPSGDLIAQYFFNGNAYDNSINGLHGTADGVSWVEDRNAKPGRAAYFDGINDNIQVPNSELLNFQDALSIIGWMNIENFTGNEQHPVSHGSWEKRYKISVSGSKIRFTLNTSQSVKDLDSESDLVSGKWYHLACVYDGNDMEIWLDGKLDAFSSHTGLINKTSYKLVFGQNLPGQDGYNFNGSLDAVSIFNYALPEEEIKGNLELTGLPKTLSSEKQFTVFPNPVTGPDIHILFQNSAAGEVFITLHDLSGKMVARKRTFLANPGITVIDVPAGELTNGIYILSLKARDEIEKELIILSR